SEDRASGIIHAVWRSSGVRELRKNNEAFNIGDRIGIRDGAATDLRLDEAERIQGLSPEISTFIALGFCTDAAGHGLVPLQPEPGIHFGFREMERQTVHSVRWRWDRKLHLRAGFPGGARPGGRHASAGAAYG